MAIDPITGAIIATGGISLIKDLFGGDKAKEQRQQIIDARKQRYTEDLRIKRGEFTAAESKNIVDRGSPRLNAIQANLSARGISADSGTAGQLSAEAISGLFREEQDRAAALAARDFDQLQIAQIAELDRQEANDAAYNQALGQLAFLYTRFKGEQALAKYNPDKDPELNGMIGLLELDAGQGTAIV